MLLLGFLSVLIMLIIAYALMREGMLTAFVTCCNVFISGLIAFNFWEPLADFLDPVVATNALHGYEDTICLFLLFIVPLLLLRWTTNQLAPRMPEYHPAVQFGGSVFFGLVTGYLLSGFLLCVLQTLPWHEKFLGFEPEFNPADSSAAIRRVLPPDRIWLVLMHQLSTETPLPYRGEFPADTLKAPAHR
jgi:hypothetical protein